MENQRTPRTPQTPKNGLSISHRHTIGALQIFDQGLEKAMYIVSVETADIVGKTHGKMVV